MPTVHLIIKGKVQGVLYRATAKDIAQALEVTGWIKNKAGGYVEAIASGSEHKLQQFIEWCRRGPDGATVTSINVSAIGEENFDSFRIIK